MPFPRATGILLHPVSLPSPGGIGDFGATAYEFVDFLAAARQSLWQVLPLGPPANGDSPYSSSSAFAGNPLLISLDRLAEHGWISLAKVRELPNPAGPIDYVEVRRVKLPLLNEACANFLASANSEQGARFDRFCEQNSWWLEDFVLYDALLARYQVKLWKDWPENLARREAAALAAAREELASELNLRRVLQFFFYEQWRALRRYCAEKSVRVVGDIAFSWITKAPMYGRTASYFG